MRFSKTFAVTLFLTAVSIGASQSYAGFGYSYLGGSSGEESTQSENIRMDGLPIAKNEKTPTLQVFQEKYVPDAVRKKYNLHDSWYDNGAGKPDVSLAMPVEPVSPSNTITWDDPSPAPISLQAQPAEVVDTWRARKDENLRDVLQRWATRADTNLMWASVDAPNLPKDFSMVGKFQDAVNALIKEAGGDAIHSQYRAEGMSPIMTTMASTVTTSAPAPLPNNIAVVPEKKNIFSEVFAPEVKKDTKPETRWFGLSGAPLAEVIRVWADDAGVTLIWQSEKNFALKNSVSQVGQFEDAIFQALSQYDDEDIRPVGEMYNDPQSGRQVLVVRTDIAK